MLNAWICLSRATLMAGLILAFAPVAPVFGARSGWLDRASHRTSP